MPPPFEASQEGYWRKHIDPGRRQFDRQRYAVQHSANLEHSCAIVVIDGEFAAHRPGARRVAEPRGLAEAGHDFVVGRCTAVLCAKKIRCTATFCIEFGGGECIGATVFDQCTADY